MNASPSYAIFFNCFLICFLSVLDLLTFVKDSSVHWMHPPPHSHAFSILVSLHSVIFLQSYRIWSHTSRAAYKPRCPCGKQVDSRSTHGLSYKWGAVRSLRHHELNDIIYRVLTRASTPSVVESPGLPGLSRTDGDGKRPDGLIRIPWERGKSVTWDVTVIDTIADSYLHLTSAKAGGAAENATTRKEDKYVDLQQTYTFVPLAMETLGHSNVKGMEFLHELDRRLAVISDGNSQTSFLFQRMSITLQQFNAIMFADTSVTTPELETMFLWLCRDRRHHWVFHFPFAFDFRSVRFSLHLFHFID